MENYLADVLDQLINEGLQIKRGDSEFEAGRLQGYYEIVSRLLNQAEAFGLSCRNACETTASRICLGNNLDFKLMHYLRNRPALLRCFPLVPAQISPAGHCHV